MIDPKRAFAYYSRPEIQEALVAHAKDKEVVGSINNETFRKRPDIIQYPADVHELAKQGVTSFHASEELWYNPLLLQAGMQRKQMDENRKGWDLLLDIDCPELDFSRIAAYFLSEAIKYHDITSTSIKFSGNHGFHIGIPFEAFPEKLGDKEIRTLFPEAPRLIAAYLKEFIRNNLKAKLLEKYTIQEIATKAKKELRGEFDPFSILAIDTVLISPRHLYRMPYSCNEKAGLVSLPISPEEIMSFAKEEASPEKVKPLLMFMEREKTREGEAKRLLQEAYDCKVLEPEVFIGMTGKKREFNDIQGMIPEQFFPPCIQNILKGLLDGKKRSLFMLTNFLQSCNWPNEKIEEIVMGWNKRNPEQLRETIIVGHLRYMKLRKEKILPSNCKSQYEEIGVCQPDNFCNRIKNPAQYAKKKAFLTNRAKDEAEKPKQQRQALTEEQKEMRRKYKEQQRTVI